MHIFPVSHLPKVRFKWDWHEYKSGSGSQLLQDLEDVCREWTQTFRWSCLWFFIEDGPIFTQEAVDVGLFSSDKDGNGADISRPSDLSKGSPMNRKNYWFSSCDVLDEQLISQYYLRRIPQGIEVPSPWIPRGFMCELSPSPHCTARSKWRNAWKKTLRSLRDLTYDISVTPWYMVAEWELWRYWRFQWQSGGNLVSSCFASETSVAVSS